MRCAVRRTGVGDQVGRDEAGGRARARDAERAGLGESRLQLGGDRRLASPTLAKTGDDGPTVLLAAVLAALGLRRDLLDDELDADDRLQLLGDEGLRRITDRPRFHPG